MIFEHSTDNDLKQLAREIKNKYKVFSVNVVFEKLKKKREALKKKSLETQPDSC